MTTVKRHWTWLTNTVCIILQYLHFLSVLFPLIVHMVTESCDLKPVTAFGLISSNYCTFYG